MREKGKAGSKWNVKKDTKGKENFLTILSSIFYCLKIGKKKEEAKNKGKGP
jgi:hypothetical protein